MYKTMEYYKDIFPVIYTNMIKVGELSDSLTKSLSQAAQYLEQTSKLKKQINDILVPNLIQFIGIVILLFAGTLIAIPQIQNLFEMVGTQEQLPAITIAFSNFVNLTIRIWYIPVLIIAIIIAAIVYYIKTPKGKYNYHKLKYRMPFFGKLIFTMDMQKFLKALHLNLLNDMRLQDAINVSKNVIKNEILLAAIENSNNNLIVGESWVKPFEKLKYCPTMITEMLKIGMQTNLIEILYKILEYLENDIQNLLEKIVKILPNVVTALVGVILIFFVIVVLIPLIQVYMGTFLFSAYGF